MITEGRALVRGRLAAVAAGESGPGRFQVLAAITAFHTYARHVRDTDWSQVIMLYDQLARLDPSPVVALNRALALAELDGPQVALTVVDRLELSDYQPYHATPGRPPAPPRPRERGAGRPRPGDRTVSQPGGDRRSHPTARRPRSRA